MQEIFEFFKILVVFFIAVKIVRILQPSVGDVVFSATISITARIAMYSYCHKSSHQCDYGLLHENAIHAINHTMAEAYDLFGRINYIIKTSNKL